ncbi:Cqd1p KNAG_0A01680 [Huiozyma naganishii CBS 8797]|uniref:Protein kinase domain-containing protein n=1 Tax=Huiozyma naganishii (strain ATCC MYA-139 / BCRC 22969 / CBS 8797 / KCTC 17520 / NBRC 10181 / NCYC 3082 / Yp74L-3) TaxID=1071383 RepID=J7RT27_HUIN7|nr:hypothetical protein KNAG_0A01680 [Kazachstania naganishii CBS 8797]CCK67857.1 hypothetical protein KNAG_0A01680 [Kazachstania naganishii CBS 8797]
MMFSTRLAMGALLRRAALPTVRRAAWKAGVGGSALALVATGYNSSQIRLEGRPASSLAIGDTFEMKMYLESQRELDAARERKRDTAVQRSRSLVVRLCKRLWFAMDDLLWSPLCTVVRFAHLALLIVPLAAAYPVCATAQWYKLVRFICQHAGPTFIKLGQWAASRTDLFPPELCEELSSLHSNVSPHPFAYTESTLCEVFQVERLDQVFDEFHRTPLGVGAIAQVHAAHRRDTDQWCAVKIIHPRAARIINRDLQIMRFWAATVNMIPTMEWLSLPDEVAQFAILMRLQLDLRIEAQNLTRFHENFPQSVTTKFPQALDMEHTTRDVLIEEYINGFPMGKFLQEKTRIGDPELTRRVSVPFVDAFLQMLILDDFVHADLHPGNVMVRFVRTNKLGTQVISSEQEHDRIVNELKDLSRTHSDALTGKLVCLLTDYTPQICFIDVGLVTELNETNRVNFIDLFNALASFDGYKAGELMVERSRTPETAIDKQGFASKVDRLVREVKQRTFTLGTISIGDLLEQMLSMVRSHHVRMEGDFASMVIAILLLEGIGRQLDPDLDLFESSLPLLREYAINREAHSFLNSTDMWQMGALWVALETKKLMHLTIKEIYNLLKTDQLCPNY